MARTGSLEGKVIIITGASSGIGRALAKQCAELGASVTVAARRKRLLDALAAGIQEQGGIALPIKTDVSKENEVLRMVAAALDEFGRIDVLVNNAGRGLIAKIENCPLEEMRSLFNTNFFGMHTACRAVIPAMKKQGKGHIINVASLASHVAYPYYGAYAATKSAMAGFSEALRRELHPYNIRISIVYPGAVNTDFLHSSTNLEERPLRKKPTRQERRSLLRRLARKTVGRLLYQSPEDAGMEIVRCILKPQKEVFPNPYIRAKTFTYALMPGFWDRLLAVQKVEKSLFERENNP